MEESRYNKNSLQVSSSIEIANSWNLSENKRNKINSNLKNLKINEEITENEGKNLIIQWKLC